jgi:restriction system protein
MAIPDFQTCMLPLLKFYAQGGERSNRESIDALADEFKLNDAERRAMLPSGVPLVVFCVTHLTTMLSIRLV